MPASFVVAESGLELSAASPVGPVQDLVNGGGLAVCESGDQASELGKAEENEAGGSVSALSASSSRARRMVRQAWAAMARV